MVLCFCEKDEYRIFKTAIGEVLSFFTPPSPTWHFPSVRGVGEAAGTPGIGLRGEVEDAARLKGFKVTSEVQLRYCCCCC